MGKMGRCKRMEKTAKNSQKSNFREKIIWEDHHQAILEDMINQLQSPIVMAYPDFNLPFFITCDASNTGLGAVLYQTQGG